MVVMSLGIHEITPGAGEEEAGYERCPASSVFPELRRAPTISLGKESSDPVPCVHGGQDKHCLET